MDLSACGPGEAVRVVGIGLDEGMRRRCRELGLHPGVVVHVTHRAAFGGRVVAVGADRFALDGRTCAQVTVEAIGSPVDAGTR
ncbi:FeoA family protein [Cellulomonas soli]|uniref:FeoA family protein n=1 Tax=Cellulomonas soli TaxID=931535 RepID=UPI003F85C07E